MRSLTTAGFLCLVLAGCVFRASAPLPPATQEDVVFTDYSPLSRNVEIARRLLPPLTFQGVQAALALNPAGLVDQPVDLAHEKFSVYVPAGPKPARGYGLLVFVAPWEELTRPQRWRAPLDKHGLIFVAAENSGNETKVLDRRLPLALLAYQNVLKRYPVDPDRVYIGGLSGGSRVAEITALAYPDVFRGALLNAGSDPIGGEEGIYLPPKDLFDVFQTRRLVVVTGEKDEVGLSDDSATLASLREWCVLNVDVQVARRLAHEPLDPVSMDRALRSLELRPEVDSRKLERCNARIQAELASKLASGEATLARGDRDQARAQMSQIDRHFGGLAAPGILGLSAKLAAPSR